MTITLPPPSVPAPPEVAYSIWNPKEPDETVAYVADWSGELGADSIASYTMAVTSGTATIAKQEQSSRSLQFWIAGGIDGSTTTFLNTITTTSGQVLARHYSVLVESGRNVYQPSTATKRQIIEMAYEECSLSGYEFNVTPDEMFSGLRKLDALMAEWRQSSKDLGYNNPSTFGGGDLDDASGIPDAAIQGAAISLAMAIAPAMGKQMSGETRARLAKSMSVISTMCAKKSVQGWARNTVAGAGNRRWGYGSPFMPSGHRY